MCLYCIWLPLTCIGVIKAADIPENREYGSTEGSTATIANTTTATIATSASSTATAANAATIATAPAATATTTTSTTTTTDTATTTTTMNVLHGSSREEGVGEREESVGIQLPKV